MSAAALGAGLRRAAAVACVAFAAGAQAQSLASQLETASAPAMAVPTPGAQSSGLAALLNADAGSAAAASAPRLSPVREAALRDTARALGAQQGLGERSREIEAQLNRRRAELDATFRFSDLMIGAGFMPAVISEAQDAVAVEATVMRIASRVYRIDEPARPVAVPPTWRDWLLLGLNPSLRPHVPSEPAVLPRDEQERAFWRAELSAAYQIGRKQADDIFELNVARLQRTYLGMRRFYDLFARGMVTAPTIVASSSVIDREDPNTIVVGGTVFRITAGTTFVEETQQWVPLGR